MAEQKMTQTLAILKYMQTHKGITSMQAFEEFGATRLSGIIFRLRKQGYHIISVDHKTTNRFGGVVVYTEYQLIKD